MSLLLLFNGGYGAVDGPPPPPVFAVDFLSHGDPAVAAGALATLSEPGALAVVGPGASTDIGDGATAIVGPGPTTTIQ